MNTYIPGLAWEMQPDACVVLYANASIHDHWGDEYMQANGIHYVRLPPYSPNLQPIEGVFAELKKHVQCSISLLPTGNWPRVAPLTGRIHGLV